MIVGAKLYMENRRRSPALPVLFVTSEAFPLAKTGGLADVCGALPAALNRLGADLRLMLPGYPQSLDTAVGKRVLCDVTDLVGGEHCRLVGGRMPDSGCRVILFDCPTLFQRGGGLYQDDGGEDWPDNHRRFAAFSRAAAAVAMGETPLPWRPAVVHCNDWHTGLLAAYLHFRAGPRPKTVFTAHNLAFQGNFPVEVFPTLGLPHTALSQDGLEFYGKVSFLKAGLRYSDRLTTVSPNYAREILSAEHGCGMDGLLRSRAADLVGILNGVDYSVWNPATDRALANAYDAEDLSGKADCKAALRAETGLPNDEQAPLVIYVNRLTHQKMADVVLQALPHLVASGAQMIVHGQGEQGLERDYADIAKLHSGKVAIEIGYREAFAHRMNAGADLSLTPSRFEPCGLTTMYAMRYGALPVTRAVGGLADTVQDADARTETVSEGTGFLFEDATVADLRRCTARALERYRDKEAWRRLQRSAMRRDFGWERSARQYLTLYAGLAGAEEATGSSEDLLHRDEQGIGEVEITPAHEIERAGEFALEQRAPLVGAR
jgi:starch synthase